MRKKNLHIPVNTLPAGIGEGIVIGKASFNGPPDKHVDHPHRDNGHLFVLQEKGTTHIEIDFQKYKLKASTVIYIRPDQVHRLIAYENATITSWIVTSENLRPENEQLLADLPLAKVLALDADTRNIISATAALCIQFSERKQEKLFHSILKESCNALVVLVASQYLAQSKTKDHYSRFEVVTQSFRSVLERDFKTVKSPTAYASYLNISTPYLNECVKAATGHSVSYHIQQRVVLEAKRLLYHSNRSVKEIAAELGYDDYSYFTRLFAKVTRMTPVAFRTKNLD